METVETPLFVATRYSVEAKQQELKQLLEVEIPKTLKGINAAAAEGDLRENFEYHMLRDRQELQSAKAAKLQHDLGRVRILEPGTADTSQVNIGTVVHLSGTDGNPLEPVTILGAWDADVERRVFANGSEVAQRLLGRTVGHDVEVDGVTATIVEIEPWVATDRRVRQPSRNGRRVSYRSKPMGDCRIRNSELGIRKTFDESSPPHAP